MAAAVRVRHGCGLLKDMRGVLAAIKAGVEREVALAPDHTGDGGRASAPLSSPTHRDGCRFLLLECDHDWHDEVGRLLNKAGAGNHCEQGRRNHSPGLQPPGPTGRWMMLG